MSDPLHPPRRPNPASLALLALLMCASAGAEPTARPDARLRYQRESEACGAIRAHDARANCLSEASTRYAATRPSAPGESPEMLARNMLQRCTALPEAERSDCIARMQGQGTSRGSVAAGGIYRELVTTEAVRDPAPVPERPPAPPPARP